MIRGQQRRRRASGKQVGFIVTNPNCTSTHLVCALKPLHDAFGLAAVNVVTMQALSGAGYPGVSSMDILDNVVPYIGGEEEKIEAEPRKLLGVLDGESIRWADFIVSAQANRVAVRNGHLEAVSVKLRQTATLEQVARRVHVLPWRAPTAGAAVRARPGDHPAHRARPPAAAARPVDRQGDGDERRPVAARSAVRLQIHGAGPQYDSRGGRRRAPERRTARVRKAGSKMELCALTLAYDLFGDLVIYRDLNAMDTRLPRYSEAWHEMGLPGTNPAAQTGQAYAQALAWLLGAAQTTVAGRPA